MSRLIPHDAEEIVAVTPVTFVVKWCDDLGISHFLRVLPAQDQHLMQVLQEDFVMASVGMQ